MNCEEASLLISARLDGQLTAEEEQRLQAHLDGCADCRALAADLENIRADWTDLDDLEAPEGFTQAVMEKIEAMDSKPKVVPLFRRRSFKTAAGLAACLVLCLGVYSGGLLSTKVPQTVDTSTPEDASSFVMPTAPAPKEAQAAEQPPVSPDTPEPAAQTPAAAETPEPAPRTTAPEVPETVQKPAAPPAAQKPGTDTPAVHRADTAPEGEAVLTLERMPDGLEDLNWTEQDNVPCTVLTDRDQLEQVMALAEKQGIASTLSGEPDLACTFVLKISEL